MIDSRDYFIQFAEGSTHAFAIAVYKAVNALERAGTYQLSIAAEATQSIVLRDDEKKIATFVHVGM